MARELGLRALIRIVALVSLALASIVVAAQDDEAPDASALLDAAVEHLQASDSFKLAITQTGEPYRLAISLDGVNSLPATLISADAQVISPGQLYVSANVKMFLSLWLDVYSLDQRQWISFPSGAPWLQLPAFEDFDVNRLLAEDTGMAYVMDNLQAPKILDDAVLVGELETWQITGIAAPEGVSSLLFGFIEPQEDVEIVAHLDANDSSFVSLVITMLETLEVNEDEPTVWHIQFSDYDAERDFEPPST